VENVCNFQQAVQDASRMEVRLIPYEMAEDMDATRKLISAIQPGQRVAIFIGPEGGFDEKEIEAALAAGITPITLGKRILRTETAGMVTLSWIGFMFE
jgi:16S rRNA (uracil1498-N3)-methyltransferase